MRVAIIGQQDFGKATNQYVPLNFGDVTFDINLDPFIMKNGENPFEKMGEFILDVGAFSVYEGHEILLRFLGFDHGAGIFRMSA